jgi:GNAT superfamily N-acetyltransferase
MSATGGARVRPATGADLTALPGLEVCAGERFREVGLDAIADDDPPAVAELQVHVDDGTAWVAEVDGEVVGYAVASVVDGEGHLDQVSVLPEHTGKGLGRALVEQVCSWSAAEGHHAVTLTTFRDLDWNGPLYEHLGFVAIDDAALGPELAAVRRHEQDLGLDVAPRIAMRRPRTG